MNKRRGLYFDGPPETIPPEPVRIPQTHEGRTEAERMLDVCESVAAISAVLHQDSEQYSRFYNRYAPQISGFPGIWMVAVRAGLLLTQVAETYGPDVWSDYEYIQTIDTLVGLLMDCDCSSEELLDDDYLKTLAKEAIEQNEHS